MFEVCHAVFREMKDRRCERRIRAAARENIEKMVERAGPAGGDDRNRNRRRDGCCHLAVEAGARAVAVHRRQQNLAGAARFRFTRPLDRITIRGGGSAARENSKAPIRCPFRIDGHDDGLAAVSIGQTGHERRVGQSRTVEADLVSPSVDRCRGIIRASNAAADGERDEQLTRDRADRVCECTAALERRRDVEDHELVDPFDVVTPGEGRGISGVTKSLELHALDHGAIADIEAGDDSFGEHSGSGVRRRDGDEVREHLDAGLAGFLRMELDTK